VQLCYVDESGTPELPGTTNHYVLAGLSLPIWEWRNADEQINRICSSYGLAGCEIHTAWLLRSYPEQRRIPGFAQMSYDDRRGAVRRERAMAVLETRQKRNVKAASQAKKNFSHTDDYIHLTHDERASLVVELAYLIKSWTYATIFAECVDKMHYLTLHHPAQTIDEQAFEQVISRLEQYLKRSNPDPNSKGLVVHDNNQTVAKKHTNLMRRFHSNGTLWTSITRIIETPLFVDSKLTSMVQMADLCSYAIRRYLENREDQLISIISDRFDKVSNRVVGVRHFGQRNCSCLICAKH
jgi:hypothetical protein